MPRNLFQNHEEEIEAERERLETDRGLHAEADRIIAESEERIAALCENEKSLDELSGDELRVRRLERAYGKPATEVPD